METPTGATLLKLSDTQLTLSDPKQDIRGRKVVDSAGQDIGEIDDLMIDNKEKKVRFLQVASGGFLGLGARKFLIPVDAIQRIDKEAVRISRSREHIAGAPDYDPKLVCDQGHLDQLYTYYGIAPYWMGGYMYPTYPFYL
jgi:sporulation protein YlmC with PRC-barrel domain